MSYSQPQIDGLVSGGGKLYYNAVDLGIIDQNAATFAPGFSIEAVTGSLHGNTPIAWVNQGSEPTFTVTVKNYSKDILLDLHHDLKVITGGTTTSPTDPQAGNLEFNSTPRVLTGKALVFYPFFTDTEGNSYIDNTSNPYALAFKNALVTDMGDIEYGTDNTWMFELTFSIGMEVGTNKYGKISAGIATDGTYTQPA